MQEENKTDQEKVVDDFFKNLTTKLCNKDITMSIMHEIVSNDYVPLVTNTIHAASVLSPFAKEYVKKTMDIIGPICQEAANRFALGVAEIEANVFDYYVGRNFSREEALLLTINQEVSMRRAMEKVNGQNAKVKIKPPKK